MRSAGTTTATVLTRAIFAEGSKSVAAGLNPMDLRRGVQLGVDFVIQELKSRARLISTTEEIAQVRRPVCARGLERSCRAGWCSPVCSSRSVCAARRSQAAAGAWR